MLEANTMWEASHHMILSFLHKHEPNKPWIEGKPIWKWTCNFYDSGVIRSLKWLVRQTSKVQMWQMAIKIILMLIKQHYISRIPCQVFQFHGSMW